MLDESQIKEVAFERVISAGSKVFSPETSIFVKDFPADCDNASLSAAFKGIGTILQC